MNSPAKAAAALTARQLIASAARRFRVARLAYGHGTLNADDEAAWLMAHALDLAFEDLAENLDRPLPATVIRRAQALFARRIAERIPAAYLMHEAWLGEHRFYVDERVIVPRSFIAELLRARLRPWLLPQRPPHSILDLCTGSGCLAIVAAHTFRKAAVEGSDLSAGALAVARRNVRDHHLGKRLKLIRSDLFASLAGRRYDLILSNPPYVRAPVMHRLPAEYRREPKLALHGGADGLDLVRRILGEAAAHLNPGGWLVLEVGHNRRLVERVFPELPFIWAETSGGDDCVALLQKESMMTVLPGPVTPTRSSAVPRRRQRVR